MSYGTRKREKVDGFTNCLIPLLNYLIMIMINENIFIYFYLIKIMKINYFLTFK